MQTLICLKPFDGLTDYSEITEKISLNAMNHTEKTIFFSLFDINKLIEEYDKLDEIPEILMQIKNYIVDNALLKSDFNYFVGKSKAIDERILFAADTRYGFLLQDNICYLIGRWGYQLESDEGLYNKAIQRIASTIKVRSANRIWELEERILELEKTKEIIKRYQTDSEFYAKQFAKFGFLEEIDLK